MRCIECGTFPFCKYIENPQEKACEKFEKRNLEQLVKIIDRLERSKK